jgi:hypothetical protein
VRAAFEFAAELVRQARGHFAAEVQALMGSGCWTTLTTQAGKALITRHPAVSREEGAREDYLLWHDGPVAIRFRVQNAACPAGATQTGQGTLPGLPSAALGYDVQRLNPTPNAISSDVDGLCPTVLFLWVDRGADKLDVWAVSPVARAIAIKDTQMGSYPTIDGVRWSLAVLL